MSNGEIVAVGSKEYCVNCGHQAVTCIGKKKTCGHCFMETIECKICGDATSYMGTKLCNWCWQMENGIHHLVNKFGREKANEMLSNILKEC